MKKAMFTRVCAILGIGAAVIFGANGSFAAEDELENLPGMPSAVNNVWRYYAQGEEGNPTNAACIVKGDWVIGANFDAATGRLDLYAHYMGEGVLNMLKTIVEKDGVETPVQKIFWNNHWYRVPVSEIWMTDLASGYNQWNNFEGGLPSLGSRGGKDGNPNIRRIYIKSDVLGASGGEKLINCYYLTNIILRCPNFVKWNGGSEGVMRGTSVTNDITEVVSPNVQEIANGSLGGYITGTLVVTNQLGGVSGSACSNVYLRGDNYLGSNGNGVDATEPVRNQYVKKLTLIWPKVQEFGTGEWTQGSVLEDLTIYMPELKKVSKVYGGLLCQTKNFKKMTVLGPTVPREDVVDYLVQPFSTEMAKRGSLYCSKRWGWKEYATALTEEEKASGYVPADCFGVYTNSAGSRKAWMVHLPQEGEPQGLCIRVQ